MNMADALTIAPGQSDRVRPAPGGMPGIQQQMHRLTRMGHERLNIRLVFHNRAHMVVINHRTPSLRVASATAVSRAPHSRHAAAPIRGRCESGTWRRP